MVERKVNEVFRLREVEPEREVGIEIEMEGANFPAEVPYWNIERDGSLRGHDSREFVTKNPVRRGLVDARLKRLWAEFKNAGTVLQPSPRCGVHVHLNFQHYSMKKMFNFLEHYYIFENLLVNYCGDNRVGNLFCLRLQDAEDILIYLINTKSKGVWGIPRDFRYGSANPCALTKFGSLEFRALMTESKWKNISVWVKLLTELKDYADAHDSRDTITECSGNAAAVVWNIFGELTDHLDMDGVNDHVFQAARCVQPLVYTDYKEYSPAPKKKLKMVRLDEPFLRMAERG